MKNKSGTIAIVIVLIATIGFYCVGEFVIAPMGTLDRSPEISGISYAPNQIEIYFWGNSYTKNIEITGVVIDGEMTNVENVMVPAGSNIPGIAKIPYAWSTFPSNITMVTSTGEAFSMLYTGIIFWLENDFKLVLPKVTASEFQKYNITATETTKYPIIPTNLTTCRIEVKDWKVAQGAIKEYIDEFIVPNNVRFVVMNYLYYDGIVVFATYTNDNGVLGTAELEIRMSSNP